MCVCVRVCACVHAKSVLVVKNSQNAATNNDNQNKVENTIMSNNIPVSQSYKNKSGDLVVVCENKNTKR